MRCIGWRLTSNCILSLLVLACCSTSSFAQTPEHATESATTSAKDAVELLRTLDKLVEQNRQLEQQNSELINEISALRQYLSKRTSAAPEAGGKEQPATLKPGDTPLAPTEEAITGVTPVTPSNEAPETGAEVSTLSNKQDASADKQPQTWGKYTPNFGYKVADTQYGDLSISIYTYGRYLNQLGLNSTYTDAFGNVKNVQRRQDFQLNKVQIKFLGWLFNEKFRYFLYAWSSNASQGLGAQVVLAGNLNYAFNKAFNVGVGIRSLPGTRSVEGNFPFWRLGFGTNHEQAELYSDGRQ